MKDNYIYWRGIFKSVFTNGCDTFFTFKDNISIGDLRMIKHEEDLLKISNTAQKLLDNGDIDLAATYFWFAAEKLSSAEKWSHAARNYEKTGYCYDIEGFWEKAKEAYHNAEVMYKKVGQLGQAALMQGQVKIIEKYLSN